MASEKGLIGWGSLAWLLMILDCEGYPRVRLTSWQVTSLPGRSLLAKGLAYSERLMSR